MPALILLISLGISIFQFLQLHDPVREAILKAILITYIKILLITELLSIFSWINYPNLLIAWTLVIILDLILVFCLFLKKTTRTIQALNPGYHRKPVPDLLIITCVISLVLIITLFVAIKSPPNNFDSMTYHMPRVSHWIQNQNVKFFPTGNYRQNYSMPFAEYAILHTQILSQSDYFANLIQWTSFVYIVGITTLISKELKIDVQGQLLTGLLAATLPMGILQSSTTQNDLVVAMFCMSFLYFFILLNHELSYTNGIFAGISLGLALLTKGTGYIFCAAIGLIYGIILLVKSIGRKQILDYIKILLLIIVIAALINIGYLSRSYNWGMDPFLEVNERTIVNIISPLSTGSNLIRNGAIHLASPIYLFNQTIELLVINILGSESINPDSTFESLEFCVRFEINEDYSGNLLHFVLIGLGILFSPWLLITKKTNPVIFILLLLAVLLFSMLLKWQPWSSRLQTTIFFIGIVYVGQFSSHLLKNRHLLKVIALILFLYSLPYGLLSTTRPIMPIFPKDAQIKTTKPYLYLANKVDKYLINHPDLDEIILPIKHNFFADNSILRTDRLELYFLSNKAYYQDYLGAAGVLKSLEPQEVGLVMGPNSWEYPIWVFSDRHATLGDPYYRHVLFEDNHGKLLGEAGSLPNVLIITADDDIGLFYRNQYNVVFVSPSISILSSQ